MVLGNGRGTMQVPYELLSEIDQQFVQFELQAQGKADLIPGSSAMRNTDNDSVGGFKPLVKARTGSGIDAQAFNDKDDDSDDDRPASASGRGLDAKEAKSKDAAKPGDLAKRANANKTAPGSAVDASAVAMSAIRGGGAKPGIERLGDTQSADAANKPADKPVEPAKPALAAKPPAPPPIGKPGEFADGYGYCMVCSRGALGKHPGEPCPGCGEPMYARQYPNGKIEEIPQPGLVEQYGMTVLAGFGIAFGAVGWRVWMNRNK